MRGLVALLVCSAGLAHADDKELDKGSVVFARGGSLLKADAKGKGEAELATLPNKAAGKDVRVLRTDATGKILLADIGGKWFWMPLDGSTKTLTALPCGEGPASLDPDGSCVLCRSAAAPTKSVVVNLASGKQQTADVPALSSRIVGSGAKRRLVSADSSGVWASPMNDLRKKSLLAPEAPLRGFLPSPDGQRAVGIYADYEFDGKTKKPADVLMTFALDGQGARRKGIQKGVPIDWTFDNEYALVQEGSGACLMRFGGGQNKCWRGFTAVGAAPDGSYALVLGNRDGSKAAPAKPAAKPAPKAPPKGKPIEDDDAAPTNDDVAVPPPTGPLALYRAKLDGPYDTAPILVIKVVDGAAVWIPGK